MAPKKTHTRKQNKDQARLAKPPPTSVPEILRLSLGLPSQFAGTESHRVPFPIPVNTATAYLFILARKGSHPLWVPNRPEPVTAPSQDALEVSPISPNTPSWAPSTPSDLPSSPSRVPLEGNPPLPASPPPTFPSGSFDSSSSSDTEIAESC